MVDLNLPGIQGVEGSLLKGHVQAAGGLLPHPLVPGRCPNGAPTPREFIIQLYLSTLLFTIGPCYPLTILSDHRMGV